MQKEGRERKGSYWYFFSPSSSPDLKTMPVNCMLCPVVMVIVTRDHDCIAGCVVVCHGNQSDQLRPGLLSQYSSVTHHQIADKRLFYS